LVRGICFSVLKGILGAEGKEDYTGIGIKRMGEDLR